MKKFVLLLALSAFSVLSVAPAVMAADGCGSGRYYDDAKGKCVSEGRGSH